MSALCEKLHPFVDGELDDQEARAFRLHLGQCRTCAGDLEAAVLCDALAEEVLAGGRRRVATVELPATEEPVFATTERPGRPAPVAATTERPGPAPVAATTEKVGPAPPGHPPDELAARRRRQGIMVAVGGVAVAAAAAVLIFRTPLPESPLAELLAEPYRPIDGRVAYPGLDRYRPLARARGGADQAAQPARTELLANLEGKNDHHGLGVALLLDGQLDQAARQLAAAPTSAAVLSDSAALALQRGQAREALTLADRALAVEPRHPQAIWNRAVALEILGWRRQAAEAFGAAAALGGDPGWTAEARRRADDLHAGER